MEKIDIKSKVIEANLREFEKFSKDYDKYHNSIWQKNNIEKEVISILKNFEDTKNKKIIDIACGTGMLTQYLIKHTKNAQIYCLDLSPNMLNILKSKIDEKEFKRVKFICNDSYKYFSTTKETFDIIAVHGSLHHIFDYLEVISSSINRLNKGGIYYIGGEPKPKSEYNYYIDQTLRIWDRAINEFKGNQIKKILYILYAPLNFISPLINSKGFLSIKDKILYGKKRYRDPEELVEYWGYEKGLDLKKIIKIFREENMKDIKIGCGPTFRSNLFNKIENRLAIHPFFDILAIKH